MLVLTRSRIPQPVQVVALAGRLDREAAPVFVDYVDDTLRARPMTTALILDLTAVTSLSRGALGTVHRVHAELTRRGIRVAPVASPGGVVARLLRSGGPTATVRPYDTRRSAITAIERSASRAA